MFSRKKRQYVLRILHVIGSMDPETGGPCQGIRLAAPLSEAFGVYREVVCCDEPTAAYLGQDSFPIHALGVGDNAWGYSPKLLPWLRNNIHRFDAVVINGLWLYPAQAARKVVNDYKKRGQKTIQLFVMPHGMLDPYFQRDGSRKLKAIRNWLYWKLLESRTIKEADGMLFTCQEELLLARTTFSPYAPKQEINVGYGIAAPPPYQSTMNEAFQAKCPGVANRPYLLFLSRIHVKKGTDLLVDAYIQLVEQAETGHIIPDLVIAGPGVDSAYGQLILQKIAQKPALRERIHFPGMLTGEAKWGAFHGCDAFILPSHQENFGIAVVEALACQKPVLISNQVNIWREIVAGGGGLVADDTLSGAAQLLTQWISLSANERYQMGKRAKNVYSQHYQIDKAVIRFNEAVGYPSINVPSFVAHTRLMLS